MHQRVGVDHLNRSCHAARGLHRLPVEQPVDLQEQYGAYPLSPGHHRVIDRLGYLPGIPLLLRQKLLQKFLYAAALLLKLLLKDLLFLLVLHLLPPLLNLIYLT